MRIAHQARRQTRSRHAAILLWPLASGRADKQPAVLGAKYYTRNHKSEFPLEQFQLKSTGKVTILWKIQLKVKFGWKMPLKTHWKMPLIISEVSISGGAIFRP